MSFKVQISRLGVRVRHNKDFIIDRPAGSGDMLFLHYLTPIHIHSRAGLTCEKPGACILYTPPFRQWYRGVKQDFNHNWFHMSGRDAEKLIRRYNIPTNTIFYPARADFIIPCLEEIKDETNLAEVYSSEAVAIIVERLLLLLSRYLQQNVATVRTSRKAELLKRFKQQRATLRDAPEKPWRLETLARETHLSVSRFSVLYKEFFGLSPGEDILQARLQKAKWFLTNTTLSVKEAAYQSGFNNIYYFSRLFHRRTGCPAREYYRRYIAPA